MKKNFGAVLLSFLGFAVFPPHGEVAYARGGTEPAASSYDPVQTCLDQVQLNLAGKITPRLHVTSHHVQNPSQDMPVQCLEGNLKEIKTALRNQIANCQRRSAVEKTQTFQFGCRMVKNEDYCLNSNKEMLKIASVPNIDYAHFVGRAVREFDWYESDGRRGNEFKTLVTGYYSPTAVDASADPSDVYRYPVYAAPEGLTYIKNPKPELGQGCGVDPVTKVPLHWCIDNKNGAYSALPTREQIAEGALDGKSLKIAYFRSLYDVSNFMLEGAGSVNLRQKDGSIERVVLNVAGTNSRPNNMIGDVLKCENKKIKGSFAAYYARHPDEAYRDTVRYNPSTVFYQRGGTYEGVDHIPITPYASIATDPTSIPTGTVTLLNVPMTSACKTASSIAVAQDVGGRIKGPHIDRYTGAGAVAGRKAESFNNLGLVFMAVPKGAGSPIADCVSSTAN